MEYSQVIEPNCRTCRHSAGFHYRNYGHANVPPLPCKFSSRCKCKEYLPADNLEYVEYMEEYHGQKENRVNSL